MTAEIEKLAGDAAKIFTRDVLRAAPGNSYEGVYHDGFKAGYRAAMEMKWRPISEAPKDGTQVLLCGYVATISKPDYAVGAFLEKANVWTCFLGGKPSHWQPLPRPPEAIDE